MDQIVSSAQAAGFTTSSVVNVNAKQDFGMEFHVERPAKVGWFGTVG